MELKSVGIWSCAKVMGASMAMFGIIIGGFIALASVLGVAVNQQANAPDNPAALFVGMGVVAVIALPIMYGILGLITGVIYAAIYNLVAGLIGGIELNFEPRAQEIQY